MNETAAASGSPRLFLVRHGQSESNTIFALDTAIPGAALTPLGYRQAHAVGRRLRELLGDSLDVTVASSYALRAQQTAEGLLQGLGRKGEAATVLDGVSEIPAGVFEMKTDEESHRDYHGVLATWLSGEHEVAVPGGLTGEEVLRRYLDTWLAWVAEAVTGGAHACVLVSHGAVSRFVAGFLAGAEPAWVAHAYLPNCEFIELALPTGVGDPSAYIREVRAAAKEELARAAGTFEIVSWGPHPQG